MKLLFFRRSVLRYHLSIHFEWQKETKIKLSQGYKSVITSPVMGSKHHWRTCHTLYPQKAAPTFHWPTEVDCNWGPHLPALLARCPLRHSHAEYWDCSHEEISDDKTNSSPSLWQQYICLLCGACKLITECWNGMMVNFTQNHRYHIGPIWYSIEV